MKIERWIPIDDYEGLYEVSDQGNVRRVAVATKLADGDIAKAAECRRQGDTYHSIAESLGVTQRAVIKALNYRYKRRPLRQPMRILKPQISTHGYLQVSLCKDGIPKPLRIHTLVARAFLGPAPTGKEINHKNGIKTDPRLENLEYITHRENSLHYFNITRKTQPLLRPTIVSERQS